jgi:hypothetical protein
MGKCNWCGKSFDNGPFSNYCSKKCEKEAVDNGEKKGISYSSGIGVVILIMIIYFSFKNCNSSTKQELNENKIENNDSSSIENSTVSNTETNSENQINEEEFNSQTESNEENLTNPELTEKNESVTQTENDSTGITDNSNFRMKEYEKHQDEIKQATEMLKQEKSIDEIEESTSLTRKEIRQLRRKLRNEE